MSGVMIRFVPDGPEQREFEVQERAERDALDFDIEEQLGDEAASDARDNA